MVSDIYQGRHQIFSTRKRSKTAKRLGNLTKIKKREKDSIDSEQVLKGKIEPHPLGKMTHYSSSESAGLFTVCRVHSSVCVIRVAKLPHGGQSVLAWQSYASVAPTGPHYELPHH